MGSDCSEASTVLAVSVPNNDLNLLLGETAQLHVNMLEGFGEDTARTFDLDSAGLEGDLN